MHDCALVTAVASDEGMAAPAGPTLRQPQQLAAAPAATIVCKQTSEPLH